MDPERWQRIKETYQSALDLAPKERGAFLADACGGDGELRREIESLLAQHDKEGLLDRPASELAAGVRLGPYEILKKIGSGGMGAVFQARDTRLDRTVAVKISTAGFSRRSNSEARAISALNHPHICSLYDVGEQDGVGYLVMEYVEGETLAERLRRRALPFADVLRYGAQIAGAVAAAHAQGIVHRDLKPANVMLAESGVKVLDFGLAKQERAGDAKETATASNAIVGTLAYMAPEQLEGKPCDARSDIFALGLVLYEMAAGRKAFPADSQAALIAAVLRGEPAPLAGVPPRFAHIVRRCLERDPVRRWQSALDVKLELEALAGAKQAAFPGWHREWRWPLVIGATGALLLAALLIWRLREAPPEDLRAVQLTSYSGVEDQPSLSPDGSAVAFQWNGEKEDNFDIYVKQIGSAGMPVRLTFDPARDAYPAWSPDDRWVAFERRQKDNWAVLLIPSRGGQERQVTEITWPSQLSWTPDAKWLAFNDQDSPPTGPLSIWAINIDTLERRRLTTFMTRSAGTESPLGDISPAISPDGSVLAFARQMKSFVHSLYVQRLTRDLRPKGEPKRVTDRRYALVSGIAWTADSREIVYSGGGINVQDLWRVPASGGRAPERLPYASPAAMQPAISRSPPRLVYTWWLYNLNLWRLDIRTGERRKLIGSTLRQNAPQYSPNGRKIAFDSNRSGNEEVWTCDADGLNCQQITYFSGPDCGTPRWSPDSRWLALDSRAEGQSEIYVVAADGGHPRRITNSPTNDLVPSWSHDGRWIYFASDRSRQYQIWKAPVEGGEPVQVTRSGGYGAFESPDGKYLYYSKYSQPGLYRMPAQGGEETPILPAFPAGLVRSFGLTSKGVYFRQDEKTIQFLDTATGKISTVAVLDTVSAELTVSPDDGYVVWTQRDQNSEDLMLVDGFR